jgi:kumamolisin
MIRALAPQAQILNYETRNGNGFTGIVNRIVDDGRASIVSVSWGRCESHRASPVRDAEETAFTAAAAAGISVFVASGDSGAYGCRGAERPGIVPSTYMADLRVDTLYPAGSPHVIAVGGTSTRFGPGYTYAPESAWEDPLSHWATGGGLDEHFARPAWQRGSGVVAAAEGRDRRQVPDVAGPADNFVNLYHFYTDTQTGRPVEGTMGGTSAAAPFWAGYLTLVQQHASSSGVGRPGFVAPILYDLAATSSPGDLFHDVTTGGNLLTEATRGWDFATGLGSPRAPQLSNAIVERLRARPAG